MKKNKKIKQLRFLLIEEKITDDQFDLITQVLNRMIDIFREKKTKK